MNKNGGTQNEALKLTMGGNGKLYGIVAVKDQCPRGIDSDFHSYYKCIVIDIPCDTDVMCSQMLKATKRL